MTINVPAITWTEQADPSSPIASYAYTLSAPDDISFGLNAERFGIVTRPRFVSVDNTRNTASVTVRMYNASYTILGSQAQTVPIQAKTDRLQIIGANGTLGVTFFLSEPYAAGVNYSELLAVEGVGIDTLFVAQIFTGTGTARTIVSGVDFLETQGIAFGKQRNNVAPIQIYDTIRGEMLSLDPSSTGAQAVNVNGLTAFRDDGFDVGTSLFSSGNLWLFHSYKKAPKFLDVVTYVGNGIGSRNIPHSLGQVPGMVVVKSMQVSGVFDDWAVWHKSLSASNTLLWNSSASQTGRGGVLQSAPTSTEVPIQNNTNVSGIQYIMYVMADNLDADSQSRCGFYTGNGNVNGPTVNLGKSPRLLITKGISVSTDWCVMDSARGPSVRINLNNGAAEVSSGFFTFSATAFQAVSTDSNVNQNLETYAYWCITDP
jgi:hypothetical protein